MKQNRIPRERILAAFAKRGFHPAPPCRSEMQIFGLDIVTVVGVNPEYRTVNCIKEQIG